MQLDSFAPLACTGLLFLLTTQQQSGEGPSEAAQQLLPGLPHSPPHASLAPAEQMVPIFRRGSGGNKAQSTGRRQPVSQLQPGG